MSFVLCAGGDSINESHVHLGIKSTTGMSKMIVSAVLCPVLEVILSMVPLHLG